MSPARESALGERAATQTDPRSRSDPRIATPTPRHADQAEKKRLREEFAAKHFDKYMRAIQANIKGPFILGDAITVADLYVQNTINMVATGNADFISPSLLDAYPKLLAFRDAVRAHPIAKAEIDLTAKPKA